MTDATKINVPPPPMRRSLAGAHDYGAPGNSHLVDVALGRARNWICRRRLLGMAMLPHGGSVDGSRFPIRGGAVRNQAFVAWSESLRALHRMAPSGVF